MLAVAGGKILAGLPLGLTAVAKKRGGLR